jgi:Ribose/xylose/arabinose/galactoside ABC-type transport systems, permease components
MNAYLDALRRQVSSSSFQELLDELKTPHAWRSLLLRLRAFVALIGIIIVFSSISPAFFTGSNLLVMTEHVAIVAIMAIGETFVILTAGIDLSVGSIAGVSGMVAGGLLNNGLVLHPLDMVIYFNVPLVILIGLGVGAGAGAINGTIITKLGVAPFIATLGMLSVARGFANLRNNGATFPNLAGEPGHHNGGFDFLGTGSLLHIPFTIVLLALFVVVAAYIAKRTAFGRRVYAIGGNERAAELAGIRVNRIKMGAYVISGICAAMTGLLITSQLGAGFPDTATSYELNAIAAVVLGGTSLFGGRGTIGGTVIGAFVIGFLSDGLVLVGVSEFWQMIAKGSVIVAAVALDEAQRRRQSRASASVASIVEEVVGSDKPAARD